MSGILTEYRKIIAAIEQSFARLIVVFAELAVCGYPPRDFLEFDDFLIAVWTQLTESQASIELQQLLVDLRGIKVEGKNLYNAALCRAMEK